MGQEPHNARTCLWASPVKPQGPRARRGPSQQTPAIARDNASVPVNMRGPVHETEVGSPVEHVHVEGDPQSDKFRHTAFNLCRGGR